MANQKIAFIGTGIMGAPIAGHIMDAGYDLTVYNRTVSKTDALVARGAHLAASPADAVRDADIVFTMLGYPQDVEDVYLAGDGIISAAKTGAWLVDLTTSSPELAREIHEAAEVMDKHAVDCPVTGGEGGAIAGTLTLILGCTEPEAAPILDVLRTFSGSIYYFGAAGNGQTAKLCNQISLASCMVGMADAVTFAEVNGLDVDLMMEMVGSGMGSSRALVQLGPKAAKRDWAPGFLVEHFRKDLGLALAQAEDAQVTLPGTETAYTLYDLLCELGGKRLGTQALELLYCEMEEGAAAGLDWSVLERQDDDDEHECCHHHDHGDGECCGGHGDGECCHHHDHAGE